MAYASSGRKPFEYASKSNHSHVISDPTVQALLSACKLPGTEQHIDLNIHKLLHHIPATNNPVEHIIAVDGGYAEIEVRPQFPSATMAFLQCGALSFSVKDLESIEAQPFIDPADMSRLKNIERLKLALPIRTIRLNSETTFSASVRRIIFDFYRSQFGDGSPAETLAWLVFEEFAGQSVTWSLASCPLCHTSDVGLERSMFRSQFTCSCPACGGELFITDVLRLHEAIDEELGSGGILGYLLTTTEQIVLVHFIKALLQIKPSTLSQVMFIKDGPLAFFGQTANLHRPMRSLVRFLFKEHNLFLAGLEKSGSFVEHAQAIASMMQASQMLLLDNEYIYKYIIPGKADPTNPYGRTTYYGNKIIFKSSTGGMHVVSLPTKDILTMPTVSDFPNLFSTMSIIESLRCDMYDNALIPIALANKLVSLADHPSSKILERFAKAHVHLAG
jgi:hypothetical protein